MAWIKTKAPSEDDALRRALEALQPLYPREYDRRPGDTSESIMSSHSLFPDVLYHAFAAFGALLSPALPLSRAQHEMITTHVSALNRCHY